MIEGKLLRAENKARPNPWPERHVHGGRGQSGTSRFRRREGVAPVVDKNPGRGGGSQLLLQSREKEGKKNAARQQDIVFTMTEKKGEVG